MLAIPSIDSLINWARERPEDGYRLVRTANRFHGAEAAIRVAHVAKVWNQIRERDRLERERRSGGSALWIPEVQSALYNPLNWEWEYARQPVFTGVILEEQYLITVHEERGFRAALASAVVERCTSLLRQGHHAWKRAYRARLWDDRHRAAEAERTELERKVFRHVPEPRSAPPFQPNPRRLDLEHRLGGVLERLDAQDRSVWAVVLPDSPDVGSYILRRLKGERLTARMAEFRAWGGKIPPPSPYEVQMMHPVTGNQLGALDVSNALEEVAWLDDDDCNHLMRTLCASRASTRRVWARAWVNFMLLASESLLADVEKFHRESDSHDASEYNWNCWWEDQEADRIRNTRQEAVSHWIRSGYAYNPNESMTALVPRIEPAVLVTALVPR